jgi:hypothetical protein
VNPTESRTLGDALPEEIARVRKLLPYYREIGPAGRFALAMMEEDLRLADEANAEQDVVKMIRAYEALKEYDA